MMKVVVAQVGARMCYAVPRILHHAGMLAHFHTDALGDRGGPRLLRALPERFRPMAVRRLLGRRLPDIPAHLVTAHPDLTLRAQWRLRRARSDAEVANTHIWMGDELCRRMVRGGLRGAGAVFAVGSSSRILFEEARRLGLRTIMEAIIAPPKAERRLIEEEERRYPGWRTESAGVASAYFEDLVDAEFALADMIICGSQFVRDAIAETGGPAERCVVVPYGLSQTVALTPREAPRGRRLRVLTAGAVGLRKGSPYVLDAARVLEEACDFRMVGPIQTSDRAMTELRAAVDLRGGVPRAQMAGHYAWADVFLLPSVCEGSATVIYEALAHGLPIVTTPNAGSVVTHGQEGFIVPIRDVRAIVQALRDLMAGEQQYSEMSAAALATAKTYSFERYAAKLVEALNGLA